MDALTNGVKFELSGNKLKLEVELKNLGPSKSGQTQLFATTRGNVQIPGSDYKVGLTVYKKH